MNSPSAIEPNPVLPGTNPPGPAGRTISGKHALLVIGAVAVVAATANLLYQQFLIRKPLELWGESNLMLLLRAPQTEIWQLAPVEPPQGAAGGPNAEVEQPPLLTDLARSDDWIDQFDLAGQRLRVVQRRGVSRAQGFTHIRRALTHSTSFDWAEPPEVDPSTAQFALAFADARQRTVLVFAPGAEQVWLAGSDARVMIRPSVQAAFDQFLSGQFPGEEGAAPADGARTMAEQTEDLPGQTAPVAP